MVLLVPFLTSFNICPLERERERDRERERQRQRERERERETDRQTERERVYIHGALGSILDPHWTCSKFSHLEVCVE